jgi:hypothetical protein
MNDGALADMLAEMSDALDARLTAMRRVDALRSVASCTSVESAEAVRQRFEIAQALEADEGEASAVAKLQ